MICRLKKICLSQFLALLEIVSLAHFLSIQMSEVDGHWLCFNVLPIGGCLKPMRCCHLLSLGASFFGAPSLQWGIRGPRCMKRKKSSVLKENLLFLERGSFCLHTHHLVSLVQGCSQQHCKICAKIVYNFSCKNFA